MALELGWREVPDFENGAMEALETYQWPGNIRELKNVVERAVYASGGGQIENIKFDPFENPYGGDTTDKTDKTDGTEGTDGKNMEFTLGDVSLLEQVKELEVGALKAALEAAKFHQGEAAKLLGLSYHQFRGLYRKHKEEVETRD
jgi:psp operon transcriptional activator